MERSPRLNETSRSLQELGENVVGLADDRSVRNVSVGEKGKKEKKKKNCSVAACRFACFDL